MKEQQSPITDDEWLLRRVHKEYFESLSPPLIRPHAFKPQLTEPIVLGHVVVPGN